MTINKSGVKKILIIKLRGIGDVVLSSIVFENLKKDFPNASIDYLTEKPSNQILEPLNFINDILLFSKKNMEGRIKLAFDIRKRKYDLILDFYSNPFTAQLTFFSGAKYKAGFPYRGRKYAYNLYGPEERGKYHAAELHLKFLESIGIISNTKNLHIGLTNEDNSFAEDYFTSSFDNDFVVGISPSGGWSSKKCDPIKFAEIADAIVKKYNCKILIVWGPGDEEETDEIISLMKNKSLKAPPTSIRQMAALISVCNLLVANDSGPMHISTAVGTSTLSLHGPTSPILQGAYGAMNETVRLDELECIECNLLECPRHHECFLDLPVDRVINKIDTLIEKNSLVV